MFNFSICKTAIMTSIGANDIMDESVIKLLLQVCNFISYLISNLLSIDMEI